MKLCILGAGALLCGMLCAQTVVRVTGDSVQLSVGSGQGVRVGLRGFVHTNDTAGGRTVEVKIARFEVTGVTETRAVARILERSAGYSVTAGQRISFVERLSAANPQLELALWNAVSARKTASAYRDYLAKFPNGTFANLAREELAALGVAAGGTAERFRSVKRLPVAEPLVVKGVSMEFVQIPPGEFVMGSENGEADERPAHRVRITKGFELGKYEVTQAQWEAVMGNNPSWFNGAQRPVDQVSWNDAQEFLGKLNGLSDGYRYRLPTEAEWEYAAWAGAAGKDVDRLDEVAWYADNADKQPHPVGQKRANAWGLYDMLGNVGEWCQDWFDKGYYRSSPLADPQGPQSGEFRIIRGGDHRTPAGFLRIPVRSIGRPGIRFINVGFRCVRERIR